LELLPKTKSVIFCFVFEFLGPQPCWLTLYQRIAEKGWLMTYLLLVHTSRPCSCCRLLGAKWQHARGVFSRLFRRRLLANRTRNPVEKSSYAPLKNVFVFCFFCFLFQLIDRACDGFRFSSPIMSRETKRNKTKNEPTALLLFCLLLSFCFFVL